MVHGGASGYLNSLTKIGIETRSYLGPRFRFSTKPQQNLRNGHLTYLFSSWWQLKDLLFSSRIPGEIIQFDKHIFQVVQPPTRQACFCISRYSSWVLEKVISDAWKRNNGWYMDGIWMVYGWYMGVSENRGTPKWMVKIMETLLKWMIWGYHYFWKHPYGTGN